MNEVAEKISFENTQVAFAYRKDGELKKAAMLFLLINNNVITKLGTRLTPWAFKIGLPIHGVVRATIFSQFCGGETLEDCAATTEKLAKYHVETILDYGVEAKETEEEFEKTVNQISKSISFAEKNHHIPFVSIKVTGIAAMALLEKLHSKKTLTAEENIAWQKVKGRMYSVCKSAHDSSIGIMVDAEETWIQDPIDELAMEMMKQFNKEKPIVYNTAQLYRTDRLAFLKKSFEESVAGNFILGMKLVRGAYMEKERKRAQEQNYPSPIHSDKNATDKDYDAAVEFCVENIERISCCIGSHNERSNMLGAELAMKKGIPPSHPHLHFSQLYGMSDNITFNLAHAGYNTSKYVPFGPVKDVVPYLMRRAQENTSVGGMSSRELGLIRKELKRRKL
ncbi:MAG TPA: proline dehydrogenase family protein [Chitinophagales bacterium]|nr:proline dehydrogenase family protein [Chitinophagales bacterium]